VYYCLGFFLSFLFVTRFRINQNKETKLKQNSIPLLYIYIYALDKLETEKNKKLFKIINHARATRSWTKFLNFSLFTLSSLPSSLYKEGRDKERAEKNK